LATGNFALLPAGVMAGTVSVSRLLRNWGWVYLGNLLGSLLYAALFYLAITSWRTGQRRRGCRPCQAGGTKENIGLRGAGPKWLGRRLREGGSVQLDGNDRRNAGIELAIHGRKNRCHVAAHHDVFALGFEHSVVNMYLIPSGMMFGAPISVVQALFWNLLPVTLGNLVAGALLTGVALYTTYPAKASPVVAQTTDLAISQSEQEASFVVAAGAH